MYIRYVSFHSWFVLEVREFVTAPCRTLFMSLTSGQGRAPSDRGTSSRALGKWNIVTSLVEALDKCMYGGGPFGLRTLCVVFVMTR